MTTRDGTQDVHKPRLTTRLAVLAGACIAALGIGELALRLVAPQPVTQVTHGLYAPDPPGRYALTPGYRGSVTCGTEFDAPIEINSLGMRDREIPPKRPDRARILVLGDSYVFGYGVTAGEAVPALLAEALAELEVSGIESLNGGVPGFGLSDEADWFERHGRPLAPDLVLLGIFLDNDIQNEHPDSHVVHLVDGMVRPRDEQSGPRLWLNQHSHLFRLLHQRLSPPGRRLLGLPEPYAQRMLRQELDVYAIDPPPWVAIATATMEASLDKLVQLSREDGSELAAFLIPDATPLRPERWRALLSGLGLDPGAYDPLRVRRIYARALEARGIPVLDLSDPFAASLAEGSQLYFRTDRHWTAAGHELASGLVARFLVEQGLASPVP